MNKLMPILLTIGLSACGGGPENKFDNCVNQAMDVMFTDMAEKRGITDPDRTDLEKSISRSWEEKKNDKGMTLLIGMCKASHEKDPAKFDERFD